MKKLEVLYFASLREARGLSREVITTDCITALDLWNKLSCEYQFRHKLDIMRVAANDEYVDFTYQINDGDKLVFIPPVAGG